MGCVSLSSMFTVAASHEAVHLRVVYRAWPKILSGSFGLGMMQLHCFMGTLARQPSRAKLGHVCEFRVYSEVFQLSQ